MSKYPVDFPMAEVSNVINIVRSGQLADKKEEFAHDAWWVQGYAQSQVFSLGILPFSVAPDVDPVEALEMVMQAQSVPSPQGAVPWDQILFWAISELLKLIKN
jgi:hypothetical protein